MSKNRSLLISIICLSIAVICLVGAYSQERVTLTAPALVDPGGTRFRVNQLLLQVEPPIIGVELVEVDAAGVWLPTPRKITVRYYDAEATALLNILNTANLSTKSLHKRVMEKLQLDGKLGTGTFVGTPQ